MVDGVLTIESVTNPASLTLGNDVLSQALEQRRIEAKNAYVEFAGVVLSAIQNRRAELASRRALLEKELEVVREAENKLLAATADDVVSGPKGLMPVAAVLGMKCEAMDFAADNGISVPANDDPIWSV